jgi:hypothetical protein
VEIIRAAIPARAVLHGILPVGCCLTWAAMAGATSQSTIDETDKQEHEEDWRKRRFHSESLL